MTSEKNLSTHQTEIKEYCDKRGVKELIHFAPISKMPFILRYGLLTNSILKNARSEVGDKSRLDGNDDHICLSVDFPNYKLFFRRRSDAGPAEKWCVLSVSRALTWERSCIFYPCNAARGKGSYGKRGINGLKEMFADTSEGIDRDRLLKDSYTTNPQAEILVPDAVQPKFIGRVYFETELEMDTFGDIVKNSGRQSIARKELFLPRSDYRSWQRI
jgi:hypothetical protein